MSAACCGTGLPPDPPILHAGRPISSGASRRGWLGWALFDWANQPFFTLITTFIFAPYFATVVVGEAVRGQALWSYAQAMAGVLIAVLAPIAGAVGDQGSRRKPWIAVFVGVAMAAMAVLWLAVPGNGAIGLALVGVVIATVAVELAILFNNAMLPGLIQDRALGRLSGFGWGLGYVGGLAALVILLLGFGAGVTGDTANGYFAARISGPFSALWLALFSLPLFWFTPDRQRRALAPTIALCQGLARLKATLGGLSRMPTISRFLIARMLYFDGLSAVYAFGGIYAAGIFGWRTPTLGLFGILLILFSMVGAFAGGWLDDRIGSKRTIVLGLAGLIVGALGIVSLTAHSVLFGIPVAPASGGPFSGRAAQAMLVFSGLVGLCGGPVQAASRTLMARLAPPGRVAEFFGLYALSGKATAFLAPLVIGIVTAGLNSQRAGLAVVLVFLGAGLALFTGVREPRRGGPTFSDGNGACR